MVVDGSIAARCRDIPTSLQIEPKKIVYIGRMLDDDAEVCRKSIFQIGYKREPGLSDNDWLKTLPRWLPNLRHVIHVNSRLDTLDAVKFCNNTVSVTFLRVQMTPFIGGDLHRAYLKEAFFEAIEHTYIAEFTLHAHERFLNGRTGSENLRIEIERIMKPLTANEEDLVLQQFSMLKPTWIKWLSEW